MLFLLLTAGQITCRILNVVCTIQDNNKRKYIQPKHSFIFREDQLCVSANDGSHHQAYHKNIERKNSQLLRLEISILFMIIKSKTIRKER
jgi:hypothetical protein